MNLETKIKGSLIGAAVGAELGFARAVEEGRFKIKGIKQLDKVDFSPAKDYQPEVGRIYAGNSGSLVDVGVKAYLANNERATPETFGKLFKEIQKYFNAISFVFRMSSFFTIIINDFQ